MQPEFKQNGQLIWKPDSLPLRSGQRLRLGSIDFIQKVERFRVLSILTIQIHPK